MSTAKIIDRVWIKVSLSDLWRLDDFRHANNMSVQSATYFCHPQTWTEEAEMLPAEVKVVGEGTLGLGCSCYQSLGEGHQLHLLWQLRCFWKAASLDFVCEEGTKHPSPCGAAARVLIWALKSIWDCACLYVYQKLTVFVLRFGLHNSFQTNGVAASLPICHGVC